MAAALRPAPVATRVLWWAALWCALALPAAAADAGAGAGLGAGQDGRTEEEEGAPTPAPLTVGSMAIASDNNLAIEAMAVDVATDGVTYSYRLRTRAKASCRSLPAWPCPTSR